MLLPLRTKSKRQSLQWRHAERSEDPGERLTEKVLMSPFLDYYGIQVLHFIDLGIKINLELYVH